MTAKGFLRKQIIFKSYDGVYLHGIDENGKLVKAILPQLSSYKTLPTILYDGCKLNLLSGTINEEEILYPKDIIFEPDYLIDVSSLSRCVQPYGAPAIGFILNMFENSEESAPRLLGEAANLFLDDCANESIEEPATFQRSTAKFFREYSLQLSACKDIDNKFFEQLATQFANIQMKIGNVGIETDGGYRRDNTQLEPSFFCEALGLQGRIDLLQNNYQHLIELKSGKADEFRGGAKEEHRLQMTLYKEMLCYNLSIPRNNIRVHLFYSRYPRFYNEESNSTDISNALMLRNKIVALIYRMAQDGLRTMIESITPDDLNENCDTSRLWTNYIRPRFEKILTPIKESSLLLKDYFFGNIAFVAKEMLYAKTGEIKRESGRCFADIWRSSVEEKQNNGNILTDLEIIRFDEDEGIYNIVLSIPEYSDNFYPNFRAGDTIFMYRRDTEYDTAINRQVTRGTLTEITPTQLTLHLRHKQRNKVIFPKEGRYAIEHDHMDSTFRATFRDLYSLLTAPHERIALLLSQRVPQFDYERTLCGNYGNEYINDIILKAKQAKELFMLVGPPGTGKTSQALSGMVREFYNDGEDILLAAYTNRAVDEICQTLERLPEKPSYIRIGSEQSCSVEYRHRLLKNVIAHCKKRDEIHDVLKEKHIVVGTLASLTSRKELFTLKKFTTAIIDEASQILESQMAGLMTATTPDGTCAIERFVLIGDPKQLPAVVTQPASMSATKSERLQEAGIANYGISLFERLYTWYHNHPVKGIMATLNRQGRMHPEVGSFANKHFYKSILQSVPLQHQIEKLPFEQYDDNNIYQNTIATRRAAFIAIEGSEEKEQQKTNKHEAVAIARFVEAYHKLHYLNGMECCPSKDIGIIVPFRNQIAMVTREIAKLNIPNSKDIVIDTVERFQGSQRDLILFGTTISNREELGMLSSLTTDVDGTPIDRKLNVAITRARKQMFIFGNCYALSESNIYKELIKELGNIVIE